MEVTEKEIKIHYYLVKAEIQILSVRLPLSDLERFFLQIFANAKTMTTSGQISGEIHAGYSYK